MNIKEKIFVILLCFGILLLTLTAFIYKILWEQSIDLGVKKVVNALEMVVACEIVGNVTSDQVKEQYIKTFIWEREENK